MEILRDIHQKIQPTIRTLNLTDVITEVYNNNIHLEKLANIYRVCYTL